MCSAKSECKKFSPNIFNKSKCQHCFGSKDAHSAEALESNRASRKVSKCGYLFVAPDWDFTNPINRTKRWQRRWFVLYDDGELTYSVDEHPETVPQAIIDMTKVLEVSDAEDVTGNQYSIAITASDKVHFIKGTSKEESRWWFDVLVMFPRSIKGSRNKRNATFPGEKATTTLSRQTQASSRLKSDAPPSRSRFLSDNIVKVPQDMPSLSQEKKIEDVIAKGEIDQPSAPLIIDPDQIEGDFTDESKNNLIIQPQPEKQPSLVDRSRARRQAKREQRILQNLRSQSDGITTMIPKGQQTERSRINKYNVKNENESKGLNWENYQTAATRQAYRNDKNLQATSKVKESNEDTEDGLNKKKSNKSSLIDNNRNYFHTSFFNDEKENISITNTCNSPGTDKDVSRECQTDSKENLPDDEKLSSSEIHVERPKVRGDPDGCGIDGMTDHHLFIPEIRVDLHPEEFLNVKKGWLMKQSLTKEWKKYWFTLRGTSLMYYKDPAAEETNILEGIIDLTLVQDLEEVETTRNYGFRITMYDEKNYLLSAVTSGFRLNWMQALRNAANIKDRHTDLSLGEKIEQEISLLKELNDETSIKVDCRDEQKTSVDRFGALSPQSAFSSDDEFKTASEASGRMEDYFEWADEDFDPLSSSSSRTLPPSPPLNRTPISKVKERARSRSNVRVLHFDKNESSSKYHTPKENYQAAKDIVHRIDHHKSTLCGMADELNDSKETKTAIGNDKKSDPLLVDLLETEVESLKSQLEKAQRELLKLHKCNETLFAEVRSQKKDFGLGDLEKEYIVCANQGQILKQSLTEANDIIRQQQAEIESIRSYPNPSVGLSAYTHNESVTVDMCNKIVNLENEIMNLTGQLDKKTRELAEKGQNLVELEGWQQRHSSLLERYHSLRNYLEILETNGTSFEKEKILRSEYEKLEHRYLTDKVEWENKLLLSDLKFKEAVGDPSSATKDQLIGMLEQRLQQSEEKINALVFELDALSENCKQFGHIPAAKHLLEELHSNQKAEDEKPSCNVVAEMKFKLKEKETAILEYQKEMLDMKQALDKADSELLDIEYKFQKANEENAVLREKLSETEKLSEKAVNKKAALPRMNSLSDLTNIDFVTDVESMNYESLVEEHKELRQRFEKAVNEIKALKKEIRQAQSISDELELSGFKLKQNIKSVEEDYQSQLRLMSVRIEDLTAKLSVSEKCCRQLKQKLARQENKEQRRTRSLRGKDTFTVSKELELKLEDLEKKVKSMENHLIPEESESKEKLDIDKPETDNTQSVSPNSKDTVSSSVLDSLQILVRINNLESKVKGATSKLEHLKNPHQDESSVTDVSFVSSEGTTVIDGSHADIQKDVVSDSMPDNLRLKSFLSQFSDALFQCLEEAHQNASNCSCNLHHKWELLQENMHNIIQRFRDQSTMDLFLPCSVEDFHSLKDLVNQRTVFWEQKQSFLRKLGLLENYEIESGILMEKIIQEAVITGHTSNFLKKFKWSSFNIPLLEVKNLWRQTSLFNYRLERLLQKMQWSSQAGQSNGNLSNRMAEYQNMELPSLSCKDAKEILVELSKRKEATEQLMDSYKSMQLELLACALAQQTSRDSISADSEPSQEQGTNYKSDDSKTDLVSDSISMEKLTEGEIIRIIVKLSNLHQEEFQIKSQIKQHLLNSDCVDIHKKKCDFIYQCLEQDLSMTVAELKDQFRIKLESIRKGTLTEVKVFQSYVFTNLIEYIEIIAQNAILTSQYKYMLLFQPIEEHPVIITKTEVDRDFLVTAEMTISRELDLLNTEAQEYSNHFQHFIDGLQAVSDAAAKSVTYPQLSAETRRYHTPKDIMKGSADGKPSLFLSSYESRFQRSFRQRGHRSVTLPLYSSESAVLCLNCQGMQKTIKDLTEKQSSDLNEIQKTSETSIQEMKEKHTSQLTEMDNKYNEQITQLKLKIKNQEKRQKKLDEEYEQEIAALKETYEQELARKSDSKINEEAVRQRYQTEIEQLRSLCEKGLLAMENSHRRIIIELEEKHRRELEHLQVEKEQALAEETQATLAALDAMHKAHEAELQREISKFKQEFLEKMQSSYQMDTIQKEHEEEMKSIKQEILSLSEKYSIKCLENASLEERLYPLQQQLNEANSLVFELTARNKQLRALLKNNISELESAIGTLKESEETEALKLQVQLKDKKLKEKQEEIAELQQKLRSTRNNELELEGQCKQLNSSLKAERKLREDEVTSLRSRLEHIILMSSSSLEAVKFNPEKPVEKCPDVTGSQEKLNQNLSSIVSSGRELTRSPSCPGLSSSSSSIVRQYLHRPVGSIVTGRKQLFEQSKEKS